MRSERQQRAIEHLLEDPGLTGDLTDAQARPLLDWAQAQAARVAAAQQTDAALDAAVRAIRQAVAHAATTAAAADPQHLVGLAEAEFRRRAPDGIALLETTRSSTTSSAPVVFRPAPTLSLWRRVRTWLGW